MSVEARDLSFRGLFYGLPVGVYRATPAGQLLDANPALAQLLGYPDVDSLRAAPAVDLHGRPEDRQAWQAAMDRSGFVRGFETQFRCRDGTLIWVRDTARAVRDDDGHALYYEGVIEDITQAKQAEEALSDSEGQLRTILETMPTGMVVIEPDLTIRTANRALCQMLGYTAEELVGQPLMQFAHPEDVDKHLRIVAERLKPTSENRLPYRDDTRCLTRRGQTVWVNVTGRAVRDRRGEVLYALILIEDISERRRAEDELQQANESLTRWVNELEQRNREITLLSDMGDLMQSCLTDEEAAAVLSQRMPLLFPAESGAVYLLSTSRKLVEAVAAWGSLASGERVFTPEECWALRRGRIHIVDDRQTGPVCSHFQPATGLSYICIPMMAQGEPIGLVALQRDQVASQEYTRGGRARLPESKQRLATTISEQIAMALTNLKLREKLRTQSVRDPLTGLFNRRYMEETLERELRRAERKAVPVGIIMLDLDHFKTFNDSFGHLGGDALLRSVGEFVQARFRREDVVCRYGGDEFAIILPETSLEATGQRAEQLREEIKTLQVQYRGKPLSGITLSAGLAAFPEHGTALDGLMQSADTALYRAKIEGRDRVVTAHSPE